MKAGPLALRGGTGGGAVAFDSFSAAVRRAGHAPGRQGQGRRARSRSPSTATRPTAPRSRGTSATARPRPVRRTAATPSPQPGAFRATLSATNADGVTTTAAATVTVQAAAAQCPVQSDEFQGNALRPRWQVLRPTPTGLEVSGGALRLKPFGGDMHGGNATVAQPAAADDAGRRVDRDGQDRRLAAHELNDQTGLVVWRGENPNNFAKVVFNRRQNARDELLVRAPEQRQRRNAGGRRERRRVLEPAGDDPDPRRRPTASRRTRRSAPRTRSTTAPTGSR